MHPTITDDDEGPRARLALLLKHFSEIEDDREPWRVLYPLEEVLLLVTCATIASCDDFDDIAEWGKHHLDFLRRFSEFHYGIPCARWLRNLMNRIDPALFAPCFQSWIAALWPGRHDFIAIDGKTARRTHDHRKGLKALHTLSAYATTAKLTLAQLSVPEKTNEITAIPELLDQLAEHGQLEGALVTIDAMGCQVEIADKIVAHKADYLLALAWPHRDPHLHRLECGRLDRVGAQLSGATALHHHQDHRQGRHPNRAYRPLDLRYPDLHLLRAARHRTNRQSYSRPLGRGEHALAARRRVRG